MALLDAQDLTYTKLRQLNTSKTVCFQPVSALEVHGPHLPLGMDFYMARWMAEETGRRFAAGHPDWQVVQFPALPLGTDELPLAGSMNTNQRTIYNAVRSLGESLARAGYKYIVITNGHGGPRHAAALEAACRAVNKKHLVQMFTPSIAVLQQIITGRHFAAVEALLGRSLSEEEKAGLLCGEHAGGWETSFMLAQSPELVEPEYRTLPEDGPPTFGPLDALGRRAVAWQVGHGGDAEKTRQIFASLAGGIGWLLNTRYGYGGPAVSYKGAPAVASAELGHAFREVMAAECLRILEDVTSGQRSADQVRSIASEPALIQPNFWPRVGAVAALALAAFWLF